MAVEPGSAAQRAGMRPGDLLRKINGQTLEDALDVRFYAHGPATLEVQRDGALLELDLDLEPGQDPGWEIEPLSVRSCHCDCKFCFVQQLPEGLRPTLYVKDEDYRFSFLFGSYLTLVGFTSRDLERVKRLRLSPLYVSIHATDPLIRGGLLGVKRAPILPILKELTDAGLEIHGQIVLVAGMNDGPVLEETLRDLAPLYPGLASLSVVPVGLTGHRRKLPDLRRLIGAEAAAALAQVRSWQERMHSRQGSRWVYPADELILLAGDDFPPEEAYEGYPQLENGVGLVRWTLEQARAARDSLPVELPAPRRLLWVTGRSAATVLRSLAKDFQRRVKGLEIEILAASNELLGESVTVAGLLGGHDVVKAVKAHLEGRENGDYGVFLPPDCLNADGLLLDDWTVDGVAERLGLPVETFDGDWRAMLTGERS
ncbi:MAG: DUF512 domain-containing protein [Candidatus Zixiibacteriota bacterium]|nr:MAG: DUF512 domain-containing protein [candidate division Zixibacteria bacterium]